MPSTVLTPGAVNKNESGLLLPGVLRLDNADGSELQQILPVHA